MDKVANGEAMSKAYTELNKFGQNSQYDKALKSVNRILGVNPNDEKALHCKVICLIHLSRFSDALQLIIRNNLYHLIFERSYCEYRLNQPKKALATISSSCCSVLPLSLIELKAQILYRLEMYTECCEEYKNIIKNAHDDYEQERRTNWSAVVCNFFHKREENLSVFSEESYELCFNSAYSLLNDGEFSKAEKKLKICAKICRETLEEEGATENEIEEEMAIIRIQLAYCLQMQGNVKDATTIYSEFLKNKSKDTALIAVASNNTVVINKDQNVFDSKKKMRAALVEINEHKLTTKQKKAIMINNCLLSLFTNSIEYCNDLCDKLVKTYSGMEFDALLIRCACLCKDQNYNQAIEVVKKFKTDEINNVAAKFVIAQLHLLNNDVRSAIDIFFSLGDLKYKPGIVSTLVTLFLSSDNKTAASEVLRSAVEWYKKNNVSSGYLSDMWRHAADFHLRGCAAQIAACSLEELFKVNSEDLKVLAQLVIAYAQFDSQKAQEASNKLPALKAVTTPIEIDSLEATNWTMATKAVKKTKLEQSPHTSGSETQRVKMKARRQRRGKLPKNYNPAIPLDPERWLPKHERSSYKKKRDRRAKDVIKGSQGTTSHTVEQYDMSKNVPKSSPLVTQQESTTLRYLHRKGIQKKKKGRH